MFADVCGGYVFLVSGFLLKPAFDELPGRKYVLIPARLFEVMYYPSLDRWRLRFDYGVIPDAG